MHYVIALGFAAPGFKPLVKQVFADFWPFRIEDCFYSYFRQRYPFDDILNCVCASFDCRNGLFPS